MSKKQREDDGEIEAEWPGPESIKDGSPRQPVVSKLKHWCAQKWANNLKPYVTRLAVEALGLIILGAVLGAAWTGISTETIGEAMSLQQPWSGLAAGLIKAIAIWGAGWYGITVVFSRVRGGRKLGELFAKRKIKTTASCIFLTVFSFAGIVLGWGTSRIISFGQLLDVTWWQSVASLILFLVIYVVMLEWGYKRLYSLS